MNRVQFPCAKESTEYLSSTSSWSGVSLESRSNKYPLSSSGFSSASVRFLLGDSNCEDNKYQPELLFTHISFLNQQLSDPCQMWANNLITYPVYMPRTLPLSIAKVDLAPHPQYIVLNTSTGNCLGRWATRFGQLKLHLQSYM